MQTRSRIHMNRPIKTMAASLACTVMEVISQEIVKKKNEVISALYILGCTWYLGWGMTCIELTLCVLTVRSCRPLHLIPSCTKCRSTCSDSNCGMFLAASRPLDSVENSSKTHTNTLLTEIAGAMKWTGPVCCYSPIGRHSLGAPFPW